MCLEQTPHGVERTPCEKQACAVWAPMPPGTMTHHHHHHHLHDSSRTRSTQDDYECLSSVRDTLNMSGWYHGAIDFTEAKRKLRHCDIGTFLVRDSSDPNYLYTLSVKTPRGTTSVRIEYAYGKFTLDSEEALRRHAPSFDCVVKLLHHYVRWSRNKSQQIIKNGNESSSSSSSNSSSGNSSSSSIAGQLVWLEPSGRKDIAAKIVKPLRSHVPSLQHMCRVSLNRHVEPRHLDDLQIPVPLKAYLKKYPFDH